ncbi:putative hydroxyquinol 1,2-dioxygenase [Pseudomonas fluorescens]|uniref:Putative hydroxyquinol 1,2-dioxygenase n=1 Tax=Pseudomonas fluorescens TaxID=294 RepID=A0A379IFD8_PSEFL|nr:intradiol ring-cleavage dioxygenase [Pseudomonas fluorescens]SUD31461.1 putative hydroxyquinol 1,2-dioxygenase [Pseudomonas fluorescens]
MINVDENTITAAVLEQQANCPNPRLKQIMTSLICHLHDFAREVRLTEGEWEQGIDFLTRVGHITDDKRQEFILLSDTLGLTMLVNAQNNQKPPQCTESTIFGPFFVENAPLFENGGDITNGARGEPCRVSGSVRGLDGQGIPHAEVQVWQCDEDGFYDVQYPELDQAQCRGQLATATDGSFSFHSVLAQAYPIPHDGPVGQMLELLGRHPWRPAHLHFMIKAPGYQTLITHIFRDGDPYLESDAVFGVRSSLIADWKQIPGTGSDSGTATCHELNVDIVLNPVSATTTRNNHKTLEATP